MGSARAGSGMDDTRDSGRGAQGHSELGTQRSELRTQNIVVVWPHGVYVQMSRQTIEYTDLTQEADLGWRYRNGIVPCKCS